MSFTPRMIALPLGLIAFLLLGFAWFSERQANADLRDRLDFQNTEISRLTDAGKVREFAFFNSFLYEDGVNTIEAIVQSSVLNRRLQLASDLSNSLSPFLLEYGAAIEVFVRVEQLVQEGERDARAEIAENLINKIEDMAPFDQPQANVVVEEVLSRLSSIVSVLGGIASALASAFLFVTGNGRRQIETDMLAVDLEKQRVELAQMKYEAREAIAATQSPHERSET